MKGVSVGLQSMAIGLSYSYSICPISISCVHRQRTLPSRSSCGAVEETSRNRWCWLNMEVGKLFARCLASMYAMCMQMCVLIMTFVLFVAEKQGKTGEAGTSCNCVSLCRLLCVI